MDKINEVFSNDMRAARKNYNDRWIELVRQLSNDDKDGLLILTARGERVDNPELIKKYWDKKSLGIYGNQNSNKPKMEQWVYIHTATRLVKGMRGATLIKLLPTARALRNGDHVSDFFYLAMLVISRGGSLSNNNSIEWRRYYREELEPIRTMYREDVTRANDRYRASREEAGINTSDDTETGRVNHSFTYPCMKEDCRGYINTKFQCGLCFDSFCKECHKQLTDDHICNEDDISTAKLIRSDTKPCPGCGVSIHKIDGCHQMWCTQCNTAWHWQTGNIQKKVHNPHYFEYLRSLEGGAARNPNEVRCGRELDQAFIQSLSYIMKRHDTPVEVVDLVVSVISGVNEMDDFITRDLGDSPDTEDLRVAFIRGLLTEKNFKRRVQARHKKWHKDVDIRDLLVMFKQTIIDILYRYRQSMDYSKTPGEALGHATILDEINVLQEYVNTQLLVISNTYQSRPKAIRIHQRWQVGGEHQVVGLYTL